MASFLQNVALPLFTVVQPGAAKDLCGILAANNVTFRNALVVCGPSRTGAPAKRIARSLERGGLRVHVHRAESATFQEADRIKRDVIESFFPDVLIGVGGGSVIDVTKLAAGEKRLPWISVPTSASNDGFCSPVAVLRAEQERKSVGATMPIGVVADLTLLQSAPRRLLLAGVGDLLSNLSAVADWELAARRGKAAVNNLARMLALAGPRQVLAAPDPDIDDPRFLALVVEGLLLSGLAMEVCGTSRPCSGGEHLISHALDAAEAGHGLHGEQVGLATVYCLTLQGTDASPIRRFAGRLGMPVAPPALGVAREQFLAAVLHGPSMRPGRWTVLSNGRVRRDAAATYDACFGAR